MLTVLSQENMLSVSALQFEEASTVTVPLLFDDTRFLSAFVISTPTMAFVASDPSTFWVMLLIWLAIFVLIAVATSSGIFRAFAPEFRKLITADLSIVSLFLSVSFVTGTETLALTDTKLFPLADVVFEALLVLNCCCALDAKGIVFEALLVLNCCCAFDPKGTHNIDIERTNEKQRRIILKLFMCNSLPWQLLINQSIFHNHPQT
jgi:hypothetical protein